MGGHSRRDNTAVTKSAPPPTRLAHLPQAVLEYLESQITGSDGQPDWRRVTLEDGVPVVHNAAKAWEPGATTRRPSPPRPPSPLRRVELPPEGETAKRVVDTAPPARPSPPELEVPARAPAARPAPPRRSQPRPPGTPAAPPSDRPDFRSLDAARARLVTFQAPPPSPAPAASPEPDPDPDPDPELVSVAEATAVRLREEYATGLPDDTVVKIRAALREVMQFDETILMSVLRNPEQIQVSPQTAMKARPTLWFWNSGICVVAAVQPDGSIFIPVWYAGGKVLDKWPGPRSKQPESKLWPIGVPRRPRDLIRELERLGADVTQTDTHGLTTYRGQDIGTFRVVGANAYETELNWGRLSRKIRARYEEYLSETFTTPRPGPHPAGGTSDGNPGPSLDP